MTMLHKIAKVDGLNIFYREAGDPKSPKLVLLHGFPASSHQYRHLMESLSSRFHVVAPDYPGFGNSDMPRDTFQYTFDNIADVVTKFLQQIGFTSFGLYVQDYGGPIGFRITEKHPEWLEWLVIQNSNAYAEGFTAVWDGLRGEYWKSRDPEAEKKLLPFLELDTIKAIYTHGHPNPELISPDNWNMDVHFLEREGAKQVQLDMFYDYRTNVALYPQWQKFMRDTQPDTLIFWGQDDIFFTREGGEAFLKDLPKAEMHRLNSGHFAVEDSLELITEKMIAFYDRTRKAKKAA
jgi:pimeloyl-ACP methyl ester carboxylesterase